MESVKALLKKLLVQFSVRDLLVLCLAVANGLLSFRQVRPHNEWEVFFNRETVATTEFFVGMFLVIWFWNLWKNRWNTMSGSASLPTTLLVLATVQSLGCFWARSTFGATAFFESEEAMRSINFAPTSAMWEFGIWLPVIITALPFRSEYGCRQAWLRWLIPLVIYSFAAVWMVYTTYNFTQIVDLVEIAVRGIMAEQPYRRGPNIIYVYSDKEALDQQLFWSAGKGLLTSLIALGSLWSLTLVIRWRPAFGWCAALTVAAIGISGTYVLAGESLAIFAEAAPLHFAEIPALGRIHLCGSLLLLTSCFFISLRRLSIPVGQVTGAANSGQTQTRAYRKYAPAIFGVVVIVWKALEYITFSWVTEWWEYFVALAILLVTDHGLILLSSLASLGINIYRLRWNDAPTAINEQSHFDSLQATIFAVILATQLVLFVVLGMLFGFALFIVRDSPIEWITGHGGANM